jgi:hypothetical protein
MAFSEKRIEVTESKRVRKICITQRPALKCEITYIPISERNIAIGFSGATNEADRPSASASACRSDNGAGAGADVRGIAAPYGQKLP